MSLRSAAAARDTSPSLGVWDVSVGRASPALESLPAVLGAGALLPSFPGDSTGCLCKPRAPLPSSPVHFRTVRHVLHEGFGMNALNLGPNLQSPRFLITLSLFQCDFRETFLLSYLYFEPLNLHCCLKVLNFEWLLQSSLNHPGKIQLQEAAMGSSREFLLCLDLGSGQWGE